MDLSQRNNAISQGISTITAATKMLTVKFSAVSNKISMFTNIFNKAQASAQTLGVNIAFQQTRPSFTQAYMTTPQSGASQLTAADLDPIGSGRSKTLPLT